MKKTIAILTATRAEYGILKPLIQKLTKTKNFDVKVVVSGAHLSPEFGLTYREIEADGIEIDEKIEILMSADSPAAISKTMGMAMISFADYFKRTNPDLLIVLGDRYETLAVALTAVNQNIAIAHLYGGDVTEGAIDDALRHALTKLSYLHFTSTAESKKRVIQLGESPDRVFDYGLLSIDNALATDLLSKAELSDSLGLDLGQAYAVATFHPVTLESNSAYRQVKELLAVCQQRKELTFIFTKANADAEGRVINQLLAEVSKNSDNIFVYDSLGMKLYLSALKYAEFVIGNSSSGITEAPCFGIPTINIGDRQKGRIQAESVINCKPIAREINQAINIALSSDCKQRACKAINPYGDGQTTDRIVATISDFLVNETINLKKKFYDLEVD